MPKKSPVKSSESLDAASSQEPTPQLALEAAKGSATPSPVAEPSSQDISAMNLYQRTVQVRRNLPDIKPDKNVDGKYDVVTHQNINTFLRPLMNQFGLTDFISRLEATTVPTGATTHKGVPYLHNRGIYLYTVVNVDKPEERESIIVEGWGEDTGDKAPGKAQTYAFKTGRTKFFSIAAGDNEEDRISDKDIKGGPTLDAAQVSAILEKADELFGEDADEKIRIMLEKVFAVKKLDEIPSSMYEAAIARLINHKKLLQEKALKQKPAARSDDVPMAE